MCTINITARHCSNFEFFKQIGREDIVKKCITELEVIEDKEEIEVARRSLIQIDDDETREEVC